MRNHATQRREDIPFRSVLVRTEWRVGASRIYQR